MHLDWRNWKFFEEVSVHDKCGLESTYGSVFQGNISSLTFDKFPSSSHWCEKKCTENKRSLVQCSNQWKNYQAVDLTGEADEPLVCNDLHEDMKRVSTCINNANLFLASTT